MGAQGRELRGGPLPRGVRLVPLPARAVHQVQPDKHGKDAKTPPSKVQGGVVLVPRIVDKSLFRR